MLVHVYSQPLILSFVHFARKLNDSQGSKEHPTGASSKATKPRGIKRRFQKSWRSGFQLLRYKKNDKLFCYICQRDCKPRKSLSACNFLKASTNTQRLTLTRHQFSDDHCLTIFVSKQQQYMVATKEWVNKNNYHF